MAVFAGIFLACVLGTIAHNPSCFKVRVQRPLRAAASPRRV
jgi:hypothetical protein